MTEQSTIKEQQLPMINSSIEKMLSAATGAIITMSFMTPLDVIKTRLQESSKNGINEYKGTLDGLVKIFRNEGLFALWRGLVPGLIMALPATAIYYVGYDHMRDYARLKFRDNLVDTYSPLWAGGVARTISGLVVSPLELFRTRMQSTEGSQGFSAVWRGVQEMVHREGPRALWRGLLPTMLRDVPFSAIYWMGYEEMKHSPSLANLSHFQASFIAGASSGMIAAVVTTPFDVVKTQRQVTAYAAEARLTHIIRKIAIRDGIAGFFRGSVPRVVK
ncbi:hypothetical protein CU097_001938, partial [Rhizopus azygosporus]